METRVFISYTHADVDTCREVGKAFKKFNIPTWIDEERLSREAAGADFDKDIENAIRDSSCFVCLFTKNIKKSNYCGNEFRFGHALVEKEKGKRHFFILQMDKDLDPTSDFPPGCNIYSTGANILYAYDEDKLKSALSEINDTINKELIKGKSFEDIYSPLSDYVAQELVKVNDLSNVVSSIHDDLGALVGVDHITNQLQNGINYKIEGERGAGKSLILLNIYRFLLINLKNDLGIKKQNLFIPIMAKMEDLWNLSAFTNTVLFKMCNIYNAPYTLDSRAKYILILDGNRGCSRGNIPEVVNMIDDPKSNVFSKILAHCNKLVLMDKYENLNVQLLNLGDILKYITSNITSAELVSKFFQGLLSRSFDGCGIEFNSSKEYFLLLKNIFNKFKNDACAELGGSLRTSEEGFFDINLALTTQRGRLPKKLADSERIAWKKLIRGNEVFNAIRNPYYLEWLVKLFIADNDMVFPFRIRTLQAMICKNLIGRINAHEDVKDLLISNFLHPLAVEIACKNGDTKMCVLKSTFKIKTNETEFEAQAKLLIDAGLIAQIGDDLLFTQQFIYDYFLKYSSESNYTQLETNLRICKLPEVYRNFVEYIKFNEPYEDSGVDGIEIAARILLDERKGFTFTNKEKETIIDIIKKRFNSSNNIHQKISILDGVGLLFNDMSLISENKDFFDLSNNSLWKDVSGEYKISKYPITFSQFRDFVEDGYQDERYWEFGTNTLLLHNGETRTRPLPVDGNTERIFEIANHPVVGVTWYEVKAYCRWLTEKINDKYSTKIIADIPSFEEISKMIFDRIDCDNILKIINEVISPHTIPVGVLTPDEEICDLIGNVWEWTNTGIEFEGDQIISCYGGCWGKPLTKDRLKTTYPAKLQSNNIGFRVIIKNN